MPRHVAAQLARVCAGIAGSGLQCCPWYSHVSFLFLRKRESHFGREGLHSLQRGPVPTAPPWDFRLVCAHTMLLLLSCVWCQSVFCLYTCTVPMTCANVVFLHLYMHCAKGGCGLRVPRLREGVCCLYTRTVPRTCANVVFSASIHALCPGRVQSRVFLTLCMHCAKDVSRKSRAPMAFERNSWPPRGETQKRPGISLFHGSCLSQPWSCPSQTDEKTHVSGTPKRPALQVHVLLHPSSPPVTPISTKADIHTS